MDLTKTIQDLVRYYRYSPKEIFWVALVPLFASAGGMSLSFPDGSKFEPYAFWIVGAFYLLSAGSLLLAIRRYMRFSIPPVPVGEAQPLPSNAIKGPSCFTENDSELFSRLGRGNILSTLRGFVRDDQLALIHLKGPSGAGKTSLLRAGLSAELAKDNVTVIYWESVPENASQALIQTVCFKAGFPDTTILSDNLESLRKLLNADRNRRFLIILDQFEQLNPESHADIFDVLKAVVKTDPPYITHWLVSFREDYASRFQTFMQGMRREFPPSLNRIDGDDVDFLSITDAEKSLAQLLGECDIRVHQTLITDLITLQAVNQKVSPVNIGILVLMLYKLAQDIPDQELTSDDFTGAGGEVGLLKNYLEDQIKLITSTQQQRSSLYWVLLKLADGNIRIARGKTVDELMEDMGDIPRHELESALRYLTSARSRVLETISISEPHSYRFIHERFIPALRELAGDILAEEQQFRTLLEQRFSHWQSQKQWAFLLSSKEVNQYKKLRQKLGWENDNLQKDYIRRSKRRVWRTRTILCSLVVVLVTFIKLAIDYREQQDISSILISAGLPKDLNQWSGVKTLTIRGSRLKTLSARLLPKDLANLGLMNNSGLTTIESLPRSLESLAIQDENIYLGDIESFTGLQLLTIADNNSLTSLKKLPKSLTSLTIEGNDKLTSVEDLPKKLTSLTISGIKSLISLGKLPETLKSLTILDNTQLTSIEHLPTSLTSLSLDWNENLQQGDELPKGLTSLTIRSLNNLAIFKKASDGQGLAVHDTHVDGVKKLPAKLTSLTIKNHRGKVISQLPTTLKLLSVSNYSDFEPLPNSLESLFLGESRKESIETLGSLPRQLKALEISKHQLKNLGQLPSTLTSLIISDSYLESLGPLPDSLKSLTIYRVLGLKQLGPLPDALESLEIIELDTLTTIEVLPSHLTSLKLKSNKSLEQVGELPKTITSLNLGNNLNLPTVGPLPPNLISLAITGRAFDYLGALPETLTTLLIRDVRTEHLTAFPKSLTKLAIGSSTELKTIENLPANLTSLVILNNWSLRNTLQLPHHLTELVIDTKYEYSIDPSIVGEWPLDLTSACLPLDYEISNSIEKKAIQNVILDCDFFDIHQSF
jgi:hypothetical protein